MSKQKLVRIIARLSDGAALVASIGLVLMTVIIAWQVFGRYVLNSSPVWAESAALIVMLYFVLLAAAAGVYEQSHLGLRFLVLKLSIGPRRAIYVAGQLLVALFGIAMFYNGARLVDFTSTHVIPTLNISRSVAYWPFTVCGLLIALFAVFRGVSFVFDTSGDDPWS